MYIVNAIPISKSVPKNTLSYFSEKKINIGSVIKIPLRNKIVLGIVLSSDNLRDIKSSVKKADFQMKKIESAISFELFTQEFIRATKKTSDYYASPQGAVLYSLIPSVVLQNPKEFSLQKTDKKMANQKPSEILAIQDKISERISRYKNIIREEFAKGFSVFICVPTMNDMEYISENVEKGLEEYVYTINNYLNKKKIISTWNDICNKKHPVVIIGTGKFLSIPRKDIKTIIIEKENSSFYKIDGRPFVDTRKFAEFLSKEMEARVIFGDDVLRIETLWRNKEGEIFEAGHIKTRYDEKTEVLIEDLSQKKEGDEFRIFGNNLSHLIKNLEKNREKLFLFTIRKGLSPVIVCTDCGALVKCENCKHPVILYEQQNKRQFICNFCGKKREVDKKCKVCDSWRLNSLGIGIDMIEKKIKEEYKNIPLFKIDGLSVKTHKEALRVIESFNKSDFGIFLSTEMGLNYLRDMVENSAIVSIDSLFSIPNFYMSEKIFSLINQIRLLTKNKFIIQTRNPNNELFPLSAEGNIADFYRYEIENRKKFEYPPFSKFIKISVPEKKESVKETTEIIKKEFEGYNISPYLSNYSRVKNSEIINFLISIKNDKWPDNNLVRKLGVLPPNFSVEVDPENIM
ncbi:MAG: hypothetical protein WC849_02805 [Candidatus Paceibacterota bacterium]